MRVKSHSLLVAILQLNCNLQTRIMEGRLHKNPSEYEGTNSSSLEMSFQDPLNMAFVAEDESSLNLDSSKSLHIEDISTITLESSTSPTLKNFNPNISSLSCNVSSIQPPQNILQQDEDQTLMQMLGIVKNQQKKNPADFNSMRSDYEFKKKRLTHDTILNEQYSGMKAGVAGKAYQKPVQRRQQERYPEYMEEKFQRYLKRPN